VSRPFFVGPVIILFGAACSDAPPELAPMASSVAPDQVDPSGLIPGNQRAFGIPLPVQATIRSESPNAVTIDVNLKLEDVANYFRSKVEPASTQVGPKQTILQSATINGGDPNAKFDINIRRHTGTTCVVVMSRRYSGEPEGSRRKDRKDQPEQPKHKR
jgi:hypothetical protein